MCRVKLEYWLLFQNIRHFETVELSISFTNMTVIGFLFVLFISIIVGCYNGAFGRNRLEAA